MNSEKSHKTQKILSYITIVIILSNLAGCAAVGPNYKNPDKNVSERWNSKTTNSIFKEENNPEIMSEWWKTLNDSDLTSLTLRAIKGNHDIKSALARIRASRAQRGIAEANLFPSLNINTSDIYNRTKKTKSNGEKTDKYTSSFDNTYSAGFDASWEIDIFGGTRRSIEAAKADFDSTKESLRDTLVSLISEVAINYVGIRTYQARLVTIENNIKILEETYQLAQWRYKAGLTDEMSVHQALSNLESAKAQLPDINTGIEAAMNRIAILLGKQPGELHKELKNHGEIPSLPTQILIGVPADIIRRRPDIRKAERDLAAQTAKIGVATAELYPKLTLNGSIGLDALAYDSFGKKMTRLDNYSAGIGPQLSWAIFKGGSIHQNIIAQTALQEEALNTYEAAILSALEEVENSLITYADEMQKIESLTNALDSSKKAMNLALQSYSAGLTDFSNMLDTEKSVLSLEDQLVQSKGNLVSYLIKIYKALGGGWENIEIGSNQITFAGDNR